MSSSCMTFGEYIEREIRLTREDRKPNAISVRFVQLHEKEARTEPEEEEYQVLLALMGSRWKWFRASSDAREQSSNLKS